MSDRKPTALGAKRALAWLDWCRQNGWEAAELGRLSDIWWEFHDDNGELIKEAARETGGVK